MDFEQKYKEALEKAKKELQTCGSKDCDAARQIYRFFPELTESEDEKIRKALICGMNTLKANRKIKTFAAIPIDDCIAWLEKQADKDKLIKELGKYKVKYTQEVLQNHLNSMTNKDDERLRKTTIAFLKEFADEGYENAVECIDWLEKQSNNPYGGVSFEYNGNIWGMCARDNGVDVILNKELIQHVNIVKQGDTNEPINNDEFARGVLRGAAINLITWIDYNATEGNTCLSNTECKDIQDALVSGDWNKIYSYIKKKLENL